MDSFQILKVCFEERISIETYEQSVVEYLVSELKKHFDTDRVYCGIEANGSSSIFTKKKDKIAIGKQRVLHLIGSDGWEPFFVGDDNKSFYYRKRITSKTKKPE